MFKIKQFTNDQVENMVEKVTKAEISTKAEEEDQANRKHFKGLTSFINAYHAKMSLSSSLDSYKRTIGKLSVGKE